MRLAGEPLDVGSSIGDPFLDATVRLASIAEPDGKLLWSQHGEVYVGAEPVEVDRFMRRRDDGRLVVSSERSVCLEVDRATATITVEHGAAHLQRQLLASFGVPLMLHGQPTLVVHGASCALGERAIVVCADSGSGKSSLLVHLVDSGWTAISEDLCTIDLRGQPQVWPGPPWVRIAKGEPGPKAAAEAFDSGDKTGWDVAPMRAQAPTALACVVLLEPPGSDAAVLERVRTRDAIGALARHAVWLEEPEDRAAHLFDPVVTVTSAVPVYRLRLTRSAAWREQLTELLAGESLVS